MRIPALGTQSLTPRIRSGFTLLELVVVIAIIALLAAIIFPVFGRARENGRASSCIGNLKQIGLGITMYTVGPPGRAAARDEKDDFLLPPNLPGGDYSLYVAVGSPSGTPVIALPVTGDDGHRRYYLGKIHLTGDYTVTAGPLSHAGNQWSIPLTYRFTRPIPADYRPFADILVQRDHETNPTDFNGKLSWSDALATAANQNGTVTVDCVIHVPEKFVGATFDVRAGMDGAGPDGMDLPQADDAGPDRRVLLGVLKSTPEGNLSFVPASRPDQVVPK